MSVVVNQGLTVERDNASLQSSGDSGCSVIDTQLIVDMEEEAKRMRGSNQPFG